MAPFGLAWVATNGVRLREGGVVWWFVHGFDKIDLRNIMHKHANSCNHLA